MTIITDRKKGFTLAEVLITLTIIGVVAALTIPSLLANVSDKTYDAKRKGLATRMAQAISQMDSLNSYETDAETSSMNFVTEGLSKTYKITNVCEFENYSACDFPAFTSVWYTSSKRYTKDYTKFSKLNSYNTEIKLGGIDSEGAVFKTRNNESIILWYNPRCIAEQEPNELGIKNFSKEICLIMWYDIDGGNKGPNQWGKDVGWMIVLYPDTPYLVMSNSMYTRLGGERPSYSLSTSTDATPESYCENLSNQYGIAKGNWTLPSKEELYGIFAAFGDGSVNAWSANIDGSGPNDYGWRVSSNLDAQYSSRSTNGSTVCVIKEGR